ncbi:hypothetical protein BaRGS_00020483 [Batillaria attramentaria]|uniref:Uncharacterized protein n=1 Tax=Batillaria attramentaria TaxID=370345 RepID=A0ABD0KM95_9CAEN
MFRIFASRFGQQQKTHFRRYRITGTRRQCSRNTQRRSFFTGKPLCGNTEIRKAPAGPTSSKQVEVFSGICYYPLVLRDPTSDDATSRQRRRLAR